MRRRIALLLIAGTVVGLLAGCTRRETRLDEVRAAIASTRQAAAQFVYADERYDRITRVQGLMEDDFRFKASVSFDGVPAYEQVVADDALAMRFLDAARLRDLLAPNALEADVTTEIDGVTTLQALRSRRWVVDPTGAPLLNAAAVSVDELGRDPVLDAVTALDYVDGSLTQAVSVDLWSEDSLDPTYPTSEDVFPDPEEGSGVSRYDLRRPSLPAITTSGTGEAEGVALPATRHFRKMAIYVEDGRVIRVIERIEATGKLLEDLLDYTRIALEEFNVDQAVRNDLDAAIAGADSEIEIAEALFAVVNIMRVGVGEEPIVTRTMTLSFPEPDADDPIAEVALPVAPEGSDEVLEGSLAALATSTEAQQFFLSGAQEEGGGTSPEGPEGQVDGGAGSSIELEGGGGAPPEGAGGPPDGAGGTEAGDGGSGSSAEVGDAPSQPEG